VKDGKPIYMFGISSWEITPAGRYKLLRTKVSKKGTCQTKYCTNPTVTERTTGGDVNRSQCYKCRSRENRANNPRKYAWRQLQASAKKRNIAFNLTIDQFKSLIAGTNYMEQKGKKAGCLQIDRIDQSGDYSLANCRVILAEENYQREIDRKAAAHNPCDDLNPF